MPQLVTVEIGDSHGRIVASWLLIAGVVIVAEAVESWGSWARCYCRGPESNRRGGTGRMLHIHSDSLRLILMSTVLHHLPLTRFFKLTTGIFYEHSLVY